jgi:2-polyprenyl-3-methyl-5-hydroxy-6-metoxy-1,4-benzoquinol methylase
MSEIADAETLRIYDAEAANYAGLDRLGKRRRFLETFLAAVPAGGTLLDLGCGAGWAAAEMQSRGFDAHALDGSSKFASIAQQKLRRTVRVMSFEGLEDTQAFDGIWAWGSLLHVRKADLPGLLPRIAGALKPGGLLMASFKAGTGEARDEMGRLFAYYELDELRRLVAGVPLLAWDSHLEDISIDFAGKTNRIFAIQARRPLAGNATTPT